MKWTVGIDPGLVESGVVLAHEEKLEVVVDDWATYSCPPRSPDISRVVSLASCIVALIVDWVDQHGIEQLDIVVEMPVYTGNPKTFMRQMRLVEEIESGIFHMVAALLPVCWVTEVNPMASKALAGCRGKEKPVLQSPFAKSPPDIAMHTRETLADAWMHSLASWGVAGTREEYSTLHAARVISKCQGPGNRTQVHHEVSNDKIGDAE